METKCPMCQHSERGQAFRLPSHQSLSFKGLLMRSDEFQAKWVALSVSQRHFI